MDAGPADVRTWRFAGCAGIGPLSHLARSPERPCSEDPVIGNSKAPARLVRAGVFAGAVAAAALSLAIGWRNYFVYRAAGANVPLWESVAGELPIWFGWLALTPLIVTLARRWPPIGRRAARYAFIHIPAALVLSALMAAVIAIARMPLPNTPSPLSAGVGFGSFWVQVYMTVAFSFLFVYASILGLALAWVYYFEEQQRQIRESRLQTMLVQSQRDLLRTQLQPHFLFNTMHAISALMSVDVPAARRMMSGLSDLLRESLDDSAGHEVQLGEELEFLDRYLDIQLVRFRDRLRVEYDVPETTRRLLVPRLILQPIVENAISHGLAPLQRSVTIRIAAALDDADLVVTVRDDGAGLAADVREGLGIGNSRARLQHLYGASGVLALKPLQPGAETRLRLPAHVDPVDDAVSSPEVSAHTSKHAGGGRRRPQN